MVNMKELIKEDAIYSTDENEITLEVKISSNIDELQEKAERLRDVLKEANDLIDALASKDLELDIKV